MSNVAAFAWTSLVVELTPGPNMTYLAVLTLAEGRRAGLAAVAGVALGLAVVGLLAALGVGALVSSSPFLYETLRLAGFAYLLWLAYDTWRGDEDDIDPDRLAQQEEASPAAAGISMEREAFLNGLLTNLLNPKAAVFYVAIMPGFISPAAPATGQALTLAAVYVAIATGVHLTIVLLAARLRPVIVASGRSHTVRRVLAAMLVAIALWMLWATRR